MVHKEQGLDSESSRRVFGWFLEEKQFVFICSTQSQLTDGNLRVKELETDVEKFSWLFVFPESGSI